MGKHSAPSTKGKTLVRLSTVAMAATGPIAIVPGTAEAAPTTVVDAKTTSILEAIAACESGNRNVNNSTGASTASGYLQIVNGTWRANGGAAYASRAIGASRAEQFIVGARILQTQGLGAWNPSRGCWGKKISTIKPKTLITPKPDGFEVTPPKKITPETQLTNSLPTPDGHRSDPAPQPKVETKPKTKISAPKIAKKTTSTTGTSSPAKKAAASYLIKRGDTLTRIARQNGTSVQRLAQLNRDTVKNVDLIFAGARLRLR